jgi:methylmalonyl-CoA mutase N-terminal domain/subunit
VNDPFITIETSLVPREMQIGPDADHPMAMLEADLQGVSVNSLRDMEDLFDGITIGKVSVSFDISGLDCIVWMAMYVAAAEKRGIDPAALRGRLEPSALRVDRRGRDPGRR